MSSESMNSMQDHSEPHDSTSTSFALRTDPNPMGQPASPADSVSSTPTLSTSPSSPEGAVDPISVLAATEANLD